jgi:hypothetical protein
MKKILAAVAIGLVLSILILGINSAAARASNICWTKSASHTFGTWDTGFGQTVTDTTEFCANASKTKLVYRATHVGYGTIFCWENSASTYRIAGAADGSTYYVEWVDEVHFTCPTNFPAIFIHPDDKIALLAEYNGGYQIYWHS